MSETVRLTLLAGATAIGDGPVFDLDYPYISAAWQIEYPNGTPGTLTGSILGLIDGSTYGTLATFSQATANGAITALTYPLVVRKLKANISAISPGAVVNLYLALRK